MGSAIRSKSILLFMLVPAFLYFGLLNLADRKEWKTPSDGVGWVQKDGFVVAESVSSVAREAGVEVGDRLLEVSGVPIRSLNDYIEVIELLAHSAGSDVSADYRVQVAKSDLEASYVLDIQLKSQLHAQDIPLILVAFLFLGSGLVIFIRSGKAPGAFHFALLCLVAFILLLFRHSGRADAFDVTVYWFSAVAFLLLPPLFLHFCFYFPEALPWSRNHRAFKLLIYGPALLLGALHVAWFTGSLRQFGLPRNPVISHLLDRLELVHFLFYVLLAAGVLVISRYRASSRVYRRQLAWLSNGTVFGIVPFAGFYGIPYLLKLPISSWMEASVLSLGLIPLSFSYAITKYRLMDVDVIFRRGLAYFLASSALLAGYLGIAFLVIRAVRDFSPDSGFFLFALSALAIALLFTPLKDRIQEQLDRYFFRDRYLDRQSFSDFSRSLGTELEFSKLIEKISSRLCRTLDLSSVRVLLRDDSEHHVYRLQAESPASGQEFVITLPDRLLETLDRSLRTPYLHLPSRELEDAQVRLAGWGVSYIEPLIVRGRMIGFLGLGARTSGDMLSSEDLELVRGLAGYAAVAIDNARLYRSLELKAEELSHLKIHNENVIESIALGVAVVSPDGEVSVWNNAMALLSGVDSRGAVGRKIEELLPAELIKALKQVTEGANWIVSSVARLYKTHLRISGGEGRLVNVVLSPFLSRSDLNTGTLIVFEDVTEKVRLESQLMQSERLSSIGLFAAGLAHEVNTPLAGISSYIQMLLEETPKGDKHRDLLEKVEKQSFRASEIVNNLLKFSRFSESDEQEVNLNSLMLETLSLLEHQFKRSTIELRLELEPSLPRTIGNGGKLQQVFMNLFLNAKDAMPKGGRLTLKSYERNSEVVLEISDTGTGISKENVRRIYDPFFTTKEVGKGTGLGLAVSYGIIQEHSGRIAVDSRPGEGTTFIVHLPVRRLN